MRILGSEFLFLVLLVNVAMTYSLYPMKVLNRLSVAPVAFMAVGAYAGAYFTTRGHSLIVGVFVGLTISLAFSMLFMVATLRMRSHYFVIATLGLALIVRQLAFNLPSLTGGYLGIPGIPRIIGPLPLLGLVIACMALFALIERTKTGRSWRAIGVDERIASTLGIDVRKQFIVASSISAGIASIAGSFYAHIISYIDPNQFDFFVILLVVASMILGGVMHWSGPLWGAGIMTLTPEFLRPFGHFREAILGLILVGVIIFLPRGLTDIEGIRSLFSKLRRRAAAGSRSGRSRAQDGRDEVAGAPKSDDVADPAAAKGAEKL